MYGFTTPLQMLVEYGKNCDVYDLDIHTLDPDSPLMTNYQIANTIYANK